MSIYFSSNKIPELRPYDLKKRQALLILAAQKLNAPERVMLNLMKLAILVPMFLYLVWLSGWLMVLPIICATSTYLLLYRPVFFMLLTKYLTTVIDREKPST